MLVTIHSSRPIGGSITAPPSKSMAHRAVLCAALATGSSHITNLEFSKDISATLAAAGQLCARVTTGPADAVVEGLGRFAGEDGVAAYGVIMYASFLFVAVFVGYAVGSAPIVSYHYGANNRKEVNNLYRKSLKLIGVVAVVMTIGSMFIIPHVARFFVGYDENLLILTTRAFRLYGLSFLIMGFNVYASSFFTALGDGVTSALISFLRTLLFQVAAVLLLPLLLGIDGIWLAVTAAELAALLVSIGLFITRDQQFHYRKAE